MTSSNPSYKHRWMPCHHESHSMEYYNDLAIQIGLFVRLFVGVFECGFQLDTIGEPIEALRDSGAFDQ